MVWGRGSGGRDKKKWNWNKEGLPKVYSGDKNYIEKSVKYTRRLAFTKIKKEF